ncbi:hypothetical protein KFL_008270010 [Klebsormidium nitens]|uniref:F-box domain-containing protein n=1 Tax=Klebsormidium nitens TaxID=105231 RepID=A0A1Y1ISB3_KLENI|nr:hypothetical protein KFL_008270010 [Klebsormidium nitens]|eukprot:GAQ91656.1 hypothetical protein KFL_008270010 [Klebsormidium nitens]
MAPSTTIYLVLAMALLLAFCQTGASVLDTVNGSVTTLADGIGARRNLLQMVANSQCTAAGQYIADTSVSCTKNWQCTGNGQASYRSCPIGSAFKTFIGCVKHSYGRGAGSPLHACPSDHPSRENSLCYANCPGGYSGNAFMCYQNCPSGFANTPLTCTKPSVYGRGGGYCWFFNNPQANCERDNGAGNCEMWGTCSYPKCQANFSPFACCVCSPNCPGGWSDFGVGCSKPAYNRGAGVPMQCGSNEDQNGALCYPPCTNGAKEEILQSAAAIVSCAATTIATNGAAAACFVSAIAEATLVTAPTVAVFWGEKIDGLCHSLPSCAILHQAGLHDATQADGAFLEKGRKEGKGKSIPGKRRRKGLQQVSRAAMESLPNDVVSVVLHKLAVQDPRSLLRATFACEAFHREAESNRGIWKDAFFGGDSNSAGDYCKDEKVEAEILALGGYEQMVKARWAVPGCLFPEQKQGDASVIGVGRLEDSSAGEYKLSKHLVVLREKGRPLLWGLLLQDRPETLREVGDFGFKNAFRGGSPDRICLTLFTSRLEPVSSKDEREGHLKMKLKGSGRVMQRADLDLEIYNYMNVASEASDASADSEDTVTSEVSEASKDSEDVMSDDSRSWACDLDYEGRDNVWASISDGEFFYVR